MKPPLIIMDNELSRQEIIMTLWEMYYAFIKLEKQKDPNLIRFPDLELMIEYIDKNGLPKAGHI